MILVHAALFIQVNKCQCAPQAVQGSQSTAHTSPASQPSQSTVHTSLPMTHCHWSRHGD